MSKVPTPRKCEHCRREYQTMVAMEPGPDRKWWWLCIRCWKDGSTPVGEAERRAAA